MPNPIALAALLLAVLAVALVLALAAYSYKRLRAGILLLRQQLKEQLEGPLDIVHGWRNDERRLSRMLDQASTKIDKLVADRDAQRAEVRKLAKSLDELAAVLRGELIQTTKSASGLKEQLSALSGDVKGIHAEVKTLPGANTAKALTHDRAISDTAVANIVDELGPKLGVKLNARQVYHLAHRICALESASHGRLATSIDAMVIRTMGALHLCIPEKRDFRFAEIGTLYGIGAVAIYDAVRFLAKSVRLTLIDPLEGYYDEGTMDFVSPQPVSREVLERNLAIAGIPRSDVTIVQHRSESPAALEAIKDLELDMLVIDGDHTAKGVQDDFENYFPRVRLGGVIILDDYGAGEWPSIKKYADNMLRPRTDLQEVFAGHRTLMLRRI